MDMTYATHHDTRTTVALVSCSGILGDLIRRSVADLDDVAVVDDIPFQSVDSLSVAISQTRPDIVVWLMNNETMLADHPELFGADRGCAVIAVLDDGRRGALWELRPYRTALDPPSVDTLVKALRTAAMRP
jgi:hypothetical protein